MLSNSPKNETTIIDNTPQNNTMTVFVQIVFFGIALLVLLLYVFLFAQPKSEKSSDSLSERIIEINQTLNDINDIIASVEELGELALDAENRATVAEARAKAAEELLSINTPQLAAVRNFLNQGQNTQQALWAFAGAVAGFLIDRLARYVGGRLNKNSTQKTANQAGEIPA